MNEHSEKQHIHVFAARYPFKVLSDFVPVSRQAEIADCGNPEVAKSKYYVFKLLEIALKDIYNVDLHNCGITRLPCGKWQCSVCQLSMTHSGNFVAVAVSDLPVGIDAELVDPIRFNDKLQSRIFTESEAVVASKMNDGERSIYANRIWTIKEAIFKRSGADKFVAGRIDTTVADARSVSVVADGKQYYLTVASSHDAAVSFHALNVILETDDIKEINEIDL